MKDFIQLAKSQKLSDNSWSITIEKINKKTLDLGVKNPNLVEEIDERKPEEIISEIEELEKQSAQALKKIKKFL